MSLQTLIVHMWGGGFCSVISTTVILNCFLVLNVLSFCFCFFSFRKFTQRQSAAKNIDMISTSCTALHNAMVSTVSFRIL